MGDPTLLTLATYCPALHTLSLSGTKAVSDDGLRVASSVLTRIRHLDLTRCPKITDASLAPTLQKWTQLRTVTLCVAQERGGPRLHAMAERVSPVEPPVEPRG